MRQSAAVAIRTLMMTSDEPKSNSTAQLRSNDKVAGDREFTQGGFRFDTKFLKMREMSLP